MTSPPPTAPPPRTADPVPPAEPSAAPRTRSLRRALAGAAAAGWAAVGALWLLDALGRGLPAAVDRAALVLAAAAAFAWAAATAAAAWRRDRRAALGGAAALALAAAACFTGLDHELGGAYFADEGIYLGRARAMNEGTLLRPWFIYPHLLFHLDALALWAAGLFPAATAAAARAVYGVTDPNLVAALVTRCVTASMGALAVLPAMAVARRISAGTVRTAGLLAGLLAALSPLWVATAQLNLSDVAAAFFATLALVAAAGLLDDGSRRRYALAGALAGLAAGSKYPAGLVAVAIFALWLRRRVGAGSAGAGPERRGGFGRLALAAAAAAGTFLLSTPSLLAFPRQVFRGGGSDLLFGVRQYAERGWTGVVRASDARYYGELLAWDLGLPALVLGVAGAVLLPPAVRRRLAWLLPFPIAWLALLLALEVAVPRNLMPVLPALAALVGVGLAGLLARLRAALPAAPLRRRAAVAALVLAALALPAWRTAAQAATRVRPTTRDLARAWIERHLPPGSYIVQEAYTPQLGPPFALRRPRFAIRLADAELRRPEHDFLLLAGGSYNRFLRAGNLDDPVLERGARRYRELFELPLVARFPEEPLREGSEIRLHRLDPEPPPWTRRAELPASAALAGGPGPAPVEAAAGPIGFDREGRWALFKVHLEPGRYRVTVETAPPAAGSLRVLDRSARVHAVVPIEGGTSAPFELPGREKAFLYVFLGPGARLSGLTVEPEPEPETQSR